VLYFVYTLLTQPADYGKKIERGHHPQPVAKETNMKTAIYIRVSTAEQNEAGQRLEIERWLEGNGRDLSAVRWFVDKRSGKNLKRPAFEDLQKAIFMGEVQTVVVWKLSRLSRNLKDGINVLCDWLDNRGVRLVSVTEGFDFSGTVGKLVASVLFAVHQMDYENRREAQAAGIRAAKKAGKYLGRPEGTLKAEPARTLELRKQGLKDQEIANAMKISRSTVQRYLKSAKA
jgi:DNA invertase Pin-like site-specific DNA recombinase